MRSREQADISIVIVDDRPMPRRALRLLLDGEPRFTVVGEAAGTGTVGAVVAEYRPDIVVFSAHQSDDIVTVHEILAGSPESRVILLRTADRARIVGELIAAGVRGYLFNKAKPAELVAAIRAISADEERIIISMPRGSIPALGRSGRNVLSPRERDVLGLVALALSNAQIGRRLHIAETTVKRHLQNIYRKLGATSRVDALKRAAANGVLEEG
ncbi:DNA-binding NarL/FixJ family response regulator [Amycolatopsis bartoniae]|uniref:DNA-binding response regulator n=1 Tax=Amycolatopsis bartoniae TaxID=941986 RepID=A0A8H9J175_9PSEU|nr:response regulator transcription factor [Amycolatopsis bartoniae]MBB2938520.1 DNA-binding NarL/FixJ family response regulator [Amycolatopsis bartoniae]TVT10337.1 response regulator transcription factor [Amycolatopsis bartoniae]GHF70417.1 DNA-binding response regulator [Amycolatopsis bartoniae]